MRWLVLSALVVSAPAFGRTIAIGPSDSYAKIEAAQPGDVVEIAPGTYKFRIDFETPGTATQPIIVRAQDPSNRPVWDLAGTLVSAAPGSYNAADKGLGCWQLHAGHYVIDGIIFKNCVDHSSSGVRVVNAPDVTIRNCLFANNTNGVIGAGDPLTIEFSEFDQNGQPYGTDTEAHQIHISGGALEVRFSLFRDSPAGEDFRVRARDATLEYNWIARPGTYLGDLVSCEYLCGGTGTGLITQRMLLRGNVLIEGTPQDHSQLIAVFNDNQGGSSDNTGTVGDMEITLVSNTIIGTSGYTNAAVHLLNQSITAGAHLTDNAIISFKTAVLVEAPAMQTATVDGEANWFTAGTDVGALDKSKFGADPVLSPSFVPLTGSPLIGAAVDPGSLAPTFEYFQDETNALKGRVRSTVHDIGAFESTTNTPPFSGYTDTDGGVPGADAGGGGGGIMGGSGGGGGTLPARSGCAVEGQTGSAPVLWPLLLLSLIAIGVWAGRRPSQ